MFELASPKSSRKSLSGEIGVGTACPPIGLPAGGFTFSWSTIETSAMPALAMASSSDGTWPVMEVSEDAVEEPDIMENVDGSVNVS